MYPLRPGETRPRLEYTRFGYRTNKDDFGLFVSKVDWKNCRRSVTETVKATFFPNVLWIIALNSVFVGALSATQQNAASIILTLKLKFDQLGFVVLPIVVATPFVWFFGGYLADKISNWHARRNGGQREPEAHLISLIFPLAAGIAGPLLFGYAGDHTDERPLFFVLFGFFLIGFGGLTMNTLVSVYVVESYPNQAGYVFFLLCGWYMMSANNQQPRARDHVVVPADCRVLDQFPGSRHHLSTGLPQDDGHIQRHYAPL